MPEYQIQAAFLFNFAAFVSWPDTLFESPVSPLRYCTLGANAVSRILEQLISDEHQDGRSLELLCLDSISDAAGCHILFLGRDAGNDALLPAGWERDILTVGDSEAFVESGGMIALLRQRKRIHPVINMDALDASALRLSSKLLRLATLVRPGSRE